MQSLPIRVPSYTSDCSEGLSSKHMTQAGQSEHPQALLASPAEHLLPGGLLGWEAGKLQVSDDALLTEKALP